MIFGVLKYVFIYLHILYQFLFVINLAVPSQWWFGLLFLHVKQSGAPGITCQETMASTAHVAWTASVRFSNIHHDIIWLIFVNRHLYPTLGYNSATTDSQILLHAYARLRLRWGDIWKSVVFRVGCWVSIDPPDKSLMQQSHVPIFTIL